MQSPTNRPLEKLFEWARPKKKYIYGFQEGSLEDKNILGNKGANLCEVVRLGIPVPPGFVISTECCKDFLKLDVEQKVTRISDQLRSDYKNTVLELERVTGKKYGGTFPVKSDTPLPLLLSVRSGAPVSMPGMMQTVLNVGINDQIVENMAHISLNPRWAYDTYRRFLQMFGNVVLNLDEKPYEDILSAARGKRNVPHDSQLEEEDLKEVVKQFKLLANVPEDPWVQLDMAIQAVFRSWNSPRAVKYRDINNISSDYGTAVVVQSMVYGNLNAQSGSGVAFTRNPTTGAKELYGEYLSNAEGEDVVAGIRTPMKLEDLKREAPQVFELLLRYERALEEHFRDVQDIEFTVENKELFILQTRTAKRTARAGVCIAVEMVKERLISEREALLRIDAGQMDFYLHAMVEKEFANPDDPKVAPRILGRGLAASAGAAIGKVVFTIEDAKEFRDRDVNCILVRPETSADDIEGLKAAEGVLTLRGGLTSHAAVVMRGMGKSAVVGAQGLNLDSAAHTLTSIQNPDITVRTGDTITIDGSTGYVYLGQMPTVSVGQDDNFRTVMQWADRNKRLGVLTNAETVEDVQQAQRMGAEGIGLCRTEHMFFQADRINLFRSMILAQDSHERATWLLKLQPLQQRDFLEIFRIVGDAQVTIRLLDPPLHEFLPSPKSPGFEEEISTLAQHLEMEPEECQRRVLDLQESNPMLGFRGCRLAIVYPEITEMQTKAIVGAAIQARQENIEVKPQIMIPLVVTDHEVDLITPVILAAGNTVCNQGGLKFSLESLELTIGTMLETPRACIRADRIAAAKNIAFVSIGSNDLTQLVFGISRDDTQLFIPSYLEKGLIAHDPFQTIDEGGVGGMIAMAVRRCKRGNPNIKIGACGEHGGDPESIAFFNTNDVDYVSCSPFRIPVAKVAAAQAHIERSASEESLSRGDLFTRIIKQKLTV